VSSSSILDRIVAHKKQEIKKKKQKVNLETLKARVREVEEVRSFKEALSRPDELTLIAEVKKASPSRGVLREDFNPVEIARIYEENGVAAISVLTEERYFLGSMEYLAEIRKAVKIPLLCKDFIFDEYQVYESRAGGADAFLLIAALLSRERIEAFLSLGRGLGMESLVEIHTEEELARVLETSAEIIGINNRDLKTFTVDFSTVLRLRKLIPPGKIVVSESGIQSAQEVELLRQAGINAILVGEVFLKERDIGRKVRELQGGLGK
jgi:indole-3-glycerol phosphate synthase